MHVVTNLLGKRVVVMKMYWGESGGPPSSSEITQGIVRAVAHEFGASFQVLLEIAPGSCNFEQTATTRLHIVDKQEVPPRCLVSFSTEHHFSGDGYLAIVVL
jgi:hypothetical protein